MSGKIDYTAAWIFLLSVVLAAFATVAIPVWLIQPFAPQTENALRISYFLKTWSPLFTLCGSRCVRRAYHLHLAQFKTLAWKGICIAAVILMCVWFARQNHFEWMFNPLNQTEFAAAGETDFVADDDMVMTVEINGEAVAYPIRQMVYHHVVQDVSGGKPITATY